MRIGIFGGTFNPIHYGHISAAEDVRREAFLDKVILVPSHIPPHKELADATPSGKRLEAVRLAISGNPHLEVSSFEVDAKGTSYSIKTIEHFASVYKTVPYFILGQDAFNDIMSWFDAKRLFSVAHFIVISRPRARKPGLKVVMGEFAKTFKKTSHGYMSMAGRDIIFIDVAPNDISSSAIRECIKAGKPLTGFVPPAVEKYIYEERMYV
jgi:nicotinate-nucleotide adenylyltransferase